MGPLERAKGFLQNMTRATDKPKPQETRSTLIARSLLSEAQTVIENVKMLRASVIKSPEQDMVKLNLKYKEKDLNAVAHKINALPIEHFPKAEKKAVEKARQQMAGTIAPRLFEMRKEIAGLVGKRKFSGADIETLKDLMARLRNFETSSQNVKTDPLIQKELMKNRDALGKAAIKAHGSADLGKYVSWVLLNKQERGFDKLMARFGLDYVMRYSPDAETKARASALWSQIEKRER